MKIAIDARMIKSEAMHGIARYVFELLNCFASLGEQDSFFIIVNKSSPLFKMSWPKNMQFVEIQSAWISFREQWELPRVLKKLKIDLFHSPSFVAPLFCPCQMIMTIHDLNHLVLPHFYTLVHQFYYLTFVRTCIKKSRFLLTVSQFSKDEIVRTIGATRDKIFVTYNGVSENYRPIQDRKWLIYVKELYDLPEKFLFCLSNNKPHKNIHQLVRAYVHSNLTIPLVLGGQVDLKLIKIAESYGKKHLLYFTRFIEEEHLPAFYNLCSLFVYPSTYEGFGLPALEALACGAPVIVARSSSLPEVVGSHAIFIDPYDFQLISQVLEQSLKEAPFYKLEKRQKSIEHACNFSWVSMAKKTLEVYQKCLSAET